MSAGAQRFPIMQTALHSSITTEWAGVVVGEQGRNRGGWLEQCGRIKALGYSAVPLHMRDGAPDVKGPCHQSGRGRKCGRQERTK